MTYQELETLLHEAGTDTERVWWADKEAPKGGDGSFAHPVTWYEAFKMGATHIIDKTHPAPSILTRSYLQAIATAPADYQRQCLEAIIANPPMDILI